MRKELLIFVTALKTYTRLPVPVTVNMTSDTVKQSIRYFPLAGLFVGGLSYLAYWLTAQILPSPLPVISCIIAMVLLTGAFHEDGFADFCDGFGGGFDREKILSIMKDSRVGTYGATGLILLLLFKFYLISSIAPSSLLVALLIAHVVSRGAAASLIFFMPYARENDATARWKVLSTDFSAVNLAVISLSSLAILFLAPFQFLFLVPAVTIVVGILFSAYIKHKIGGYTGDCLGAMQCLVEIGVYVLFSANNYLHSTHIF